MIIKPTDIITYVRDCGISPIEGRVGVSQLNLMLELFASKAEFIKTNSEVQNDQ